MGISGLLPFVKKASKHSHIKHFAGQTVAVDAYAWLYKGAFGCAVQLGKSEPTNVYVNYCMKYVNVLLSFGLKPILVFDGRSLPAKAATNAKRKENRIANKDKAKDALRRGDSKEAWECFTKCIEVTPEMARNLIKVLRDQKIDYIIAPYEADAQLAYLSKSGIADLVLTEDSDLIVFGCSKIFFKMSLNGDGILFEQSKLNKCIDQTPDQFHFDRFRQICILSGCDYLPSLPGIGLVRAKRIFTTSINPDIKRVLKQIPIILKMDLEIPEEYINNFIEAEQTFLYQLVFDPRKRQLLPLNPYPAHLDVEKLPFAGSYEHEKIMIDLCLGNIDTRTLERVDTFDPQKGYPDKSIWSKNYKIPIKVNPFVAMKMSTKHTSTKGKVASVSLTLPGTKPARLTRASAKLEGSENSSDLSDEQLFALYSNGNKKTTAEINYETQDITEPSVALHSKDDDLVEEFSTRSKRRCINSIYNVVKKNSAEIDDEFEGRDENLSEEEDESPIPKMNPNDKSPLLKRTSRPPVKNPFAKKESPPENVPYVLSKLKSIQEKVPICYVDKKRVYDLDSPNVFIKSKYFRDVEEDNEFKRRVSPRIRTTANN